MRSAHSSGGEASDGVETVQGGQPCTKAIVAWAKANPVAWRMESGSGEKTGPEAGRVGNGGGNTVQEATPDDEDPQQMAWKVSGDGAMLDVDMQAVLDVDMEDQAVLDVDVDQKAQDVDQTASDQTKQAALDASWAVLLVHLSGCKRSTADPTTCTCFPHTLYSTLFFTVVSRDSQVALTSGQHAGPHRPLGFGGDAAGSDGMLISGETLLELLELLERLERRSPALSAQGSPSLVSTDSG